MRKKEPGVVEKGERGLGRKREGKIKNMNPPTANNNVYENARWKFSDWNVNQQRDNSNQKQIEIELVPISKKEEVSQQEAKQKFCQVVCCLIQ